MNSETSLNPAPARSLAERAVVYVDCSLARSGYLGKRWTSQLTAECEQRYKDLIAIQAARKAFGVEAIPYGLTLPLSPLVTSITPAQEPANVS
jgi:hypothetical protein